MSTKAVTKSKAPAGEQRGFELTPDMIGKIVDVAKVPLAARRVSEKYKGIMAQVLDLKPGQGFVLACPKETTIVKFRATVSSTLRKRLDGKLGKGLHLSFQIAESGGLLVSLQKDE